MRAHRATSVIAALTLSGIAGVALARPPLIVNPLPDTLRELFETLDPAKPGSIPHYLEGAQCGGWNPDESVGPIPGIGRIAVVDGFPGRPYRPLQNIDSGVAQTIDVVDVGGVAQDSFSFPVTTQGLSTVCRPGHGVTDPAGRPSVVIPIWSDEEQQRVDTFVPYPYFEDPPCLWRPNEGGPPFASQITPPHSEARCIEFCTWLNSFTYTDCSEENLEEIVVPAIPGCHDACNPLGECPAGLECVNNECLAPDGGNCDEEKKKQCKPNGLKTYSVCSEEEVPPLSAWPNCRVCAGDECRCPLPIPGPSCVLAPNGLEYQSFFRRYQGTYQRATVPNVPLDIGSKPVRAACYGFYEEFNTIDRQTNNRDWRCAVEVNDVGQLLESQQGKGLTRIDRPDLPGSASPRGNLPPNPLSLWAPFTGAFSLLQERTFHRLYDRQLTNVAIDTQHLDRALQRSTPQGANTLIQDFDDTGTGTIVRWWSKQRQMARSLFTRPVIHLLIPPPRALGLESTVPSPFDENSDPESRPIRIQLDAGEDLVGSVLRASSLQIEEVPITLPVFSSSVTEINALRHAWCLRVMQETGQASCTGGGVPANVQALLQRLEEYAAYTERVRSLRAALARHVGSALSLQNEIAEPILRRLRDVLQQVRNVLREQEEIERTLLPLWRIAEGQYHTFSARTNLPYCMNQRFTPRIPSLLDDWLPARSEAGGVTEKGTLPQTSLPTLRGLFTRSGAIVIDLSHMPILRHTVRLPVLKPIIVRISLPKPPDLGQSINATTVQLPPMPSLTAIDDALRAAWESVPRVDASRLTPPRIMLPPLLGEATQQQIRNALEGIVVTIGRMNAAYAYYWRSILGFTGDERFPRPSCQVPGDIQPLQCCGWGQIPCLAEMDLVPIIARVAARPMVNLREDLQAHGYPRGFPSVCLDRNPACLLLPPESLPAAIQWDALSPSIPGPDRIRSLRSTVDRLTLPSPLGNAVLPPLDLEPGELLPALNVPPPASLLP